jgi:SAM-dependent methyltransferase
VIGADARREAFVDREPFFAVLTSPRFLRANLTPEREREFFASGEALVAAMLRTIELRLAPHFAPTAILEYGCGVGRLALPLARHAARRAGSVVAVDRSGTMLRIARAEAERRGIVNIEFHTPAELEAARRTFDFITCYLVLQRMPPREGLALMRRLLALIASGGVGVFHLPYETTTAPLVEATRHLRERVPLVNAVANLARRRPYDQPFIPSHTYDLTEVFRLVDEASVEAVHVGFEHHDRLATALLYVEQPMARKVPSSGAGSAQRDRPIEVRDIVARTSIEEFNRAAEAYFASLTDWEHQLAKPFSHAEEAPSLLIDVATLLQGLRLAPGTPVLEFGAGTGWLSRFLTQLGCRVILLDVSPTALRMARELYDRLPIVGERPAPEFLLFDGRRIDLPDASVERTVCFHAFHHAPDPAAIVRELGRVLAPGGIAGFAEPGPRHSRAPFSQFEMRAYAVVENDVDVHDVWRAAQTAGFADIKVAIFRGVPHHASLTEFEDFLAGGETGAGFLDSTRVFLRNVRTFFLFKAGAERVDSRRIDALACEIHADACSEPAIEGQPIAINATVTNTGSAMWLPSDAAVGGVSLGAHVYDAASGRLLAFGVATAPLADPPREIAPGDTVRCRLTVPPQPGGRYIVEIDCVASHVTWFAPIGSRAERVTVDVVPRRG